MTKNDFENFAAIFERRARLSIYIFQIPYLKNGNNLRLRTTRRSKEETIWRRKFFFSLKTLIWS